MSGSPTVRYGWGYYTLTLYTVIRSGILCSVRFLQYPHPVYSVPSQSGSAPLRLGANVDQPHRKQHTNKARRSERALATQHAGASHGGTPRALADGDSLHGLRGLVLPVYVLAAALLKVRRGARLRP